MKSKIKLLLRADKLSGCHVKNGRAQWVERSIHIEGPAPSEIAHFEGFLPCNAWPTAIAGLCMPSMDVPWRDNNPDTDWLPVCSNLKALAAAILEVADIADYKTARSYGQVIALDRGTVVTTNGFRLANIPLESLTKDFQLCIGKRNALMLAKLLLVPNATLEVSQDLTILRLSSPSWSARICLSSIKFPSWREILPKKLTATLCPKEVQETVAQAKLLAKAKHDDSADTFRIALKSPTEDGFTSLRWVNPKFWAEANASSLTWHFDPKDAEAPLLGTDGVLNYILTPIAMPKAKGEKRA